MSLLLAIKNLKVSVDEKEVLKGVELTINTGEVHALMGPNGSGKSTLANTLMGHPRYAVHAGSVTFDGKDVLAMPVHERAKAGIFLAFQYPYEIEGVPLKDFIRQAYNALYGGTERQLGLKAFRQLLEDKMALLKIKPDVIERAVNVGFSGGEKKRAEMLQLAVLRPRLVILDEIDSGLDVDALKIVCECLNAIKQDNPDMAIILVTHYQRILHYITPDFVHIMESGMITLSGDKHLAERIEQAGYESDF